MKLRKTPFALILFAVCVAAFAFQIARRAMRVPSASLTAVLPQGALLAIEAPDFAGLLQIWNASSEQKAWLASENYSVFSNSRLFGRLSDAQTEFASVSGIAAGDLLAQVAGTQSVFAWYDIGNLEFLYVTRMPPAQAARTELVKSRARWKTRESAGIPFYLRTATAVGSTTKRTVAFATVGDLMLLATREDLMANALVLLAHPAAASGGSTQGLEAEPWFSEASAALVQGPGKPALHMVLNLDRLVPTPYFRSYWVQRNMTAMKQYRASVADLYVAKGTFREERALLLKTLPPVPPESTNLNLAELAALAPAGGVYRANATTDPATAVTALEEKLLGRENQATPPVEDAPDPTLEAVHAGAANDLEVRIDMPGPVSATSSNEALVQVCESAGLNSVLTWSAAAMPEQTSGLWLPIHAAVVLRGSRPWPPPVVAAALQQSLRGSLTAGNLGIDFHTSQASGHTLYTLAGPKPLVFALIANDLLVADDAATLQQLLASPATPFTAQPTTHAATLIAGFDHNGQRAPFARLSSLIDGTNAPAPPPAAAAAPTFFSGNIRSLSDALATLQSERLVEFHDGATVRQTVTYQWQPR